MVVDKFLKDNDYLFWVDVDFEYIPPDIINALLKFNVDIVSPPLYLRDGSLYDLSTSRDGKTLKDLPDEELLEVDHINAVALISRRVFERGVNYIDLIDSHDQEGGIFSQVAIAKGFKLYSATRCRIIHVTYSGTNVVHV
jgi:hypothetical protein